MLQNIRIGCFETNSSSTHSLILCSEEEYEKLKKGELLITCDDELITKEQAYDEFIPDFFSSKYGLCNHLDEFSDKFPGKEWEELSKSERFKFVCECWGYGDIPKTLDGWINDEYLSWDSGLYKTPGSEKIHWIAKYGYDA